jgi:ubiquitin carboxyl-terminal hydrolase 5/13
MTMDESLLERIRAQLPNVKVPSSYDRVYKDECMYSYAFAESDQGIFVNLKTWHGVGAHFLQLDCERSGNMLYYNEQHHRIPLSSEELEAQNAIPTKLAIGGDSGFQVNAKDYKIEKECSLVLMPERVVIPLPSPELPELVLNAIAGIQVRR